MAGFLFGSAMRDDGRASQRQSQHVERAGGLDLGALLVEDRHLDRAGALSTVLFGPGHAQKSVLVKLALPVTQELDLIAAHRAEIAGAPAFRQVGCEKRLYFLPEPLFFGP